MRLIPLTGAEWSLAPRASVMQVDHTVGVSLSIKRISIALTGMRRRYHVIAITGWREQWVGLAGRVKKN